VPVTPCVHPQSEGVWGRTDLPRGLNWRMVLRSLASSITTAAATTPKAIGSTQWR